MTKYVQIQGSYVGTFDSVTNEFNRDFELGLNPLINIIYTELSAINIYLDADGAQTIDFGGIANAKMIVICSDQPITFNLDSSVTAHPCNPLAILTNNAAGSYLSSLTITRTPSMNTNVKIRIYG